MERAAIIVAGGTGTRFGGAVPKQFMLLQGKPILWHALMAFHAADRDMRIVLVLPEQHLDIWRTMCIGHGITVEHEVVAGGSERYHSVRAGVFSLSGKPIIAVHDGVRPLVSKDLIERCFAEAAAHGSAIPVVPVTSSFRLVENGNSRAIDRSALRVVQTPQCFQADVLREAFEQRFDPRFTDEASLVEGTGRQVHLVEGEITNIKVTRPMDLRLLEGLMGRTD
ncbi:MAG: 2-C-methyl-D-erythritol 4-phosphate cytidylyltransferase [Flavobacteriales bacterium]|nr:2-C-methyl-D-erythritol 4-phosphate cytidylyltransferase [Flavobacteriales bacterium]